jgi:hypothetical protein
MSRDALARRGGGSGPPGAEDMVGMVTRLREPEREVAILRLLLGHSLAHTAHLSGYNRRAAMELQLAAGRTIHELTGGTPDGGQPPPAGPAPQPPGHRRTATCPTRPPPPRDGPGCPAPTTRVAAADGGSSGGTPPTTVVEPSTTSPTGSDEVGPLDGRAQDLGGDRSAE